VVLWLAAPALADALDASPDRRERRLSVRVRSDTLRYALLHWRYFERFVSAETHWLAPDNVQETPERVVAMRTSPTNIGLQLLATTSAYDLGFLEVDALVAMLERIFGTMRKLRRFRGHFYNWYDLGSLDDLAPGYVSTVDSGNLAGHLLALRQACLTLPDAPVSDRRVWRAVDAALSLAVEAIEAEGRSPAGIQRVRAAVAAAESRQDPSAAIDSVVELLQAADRTLSGGRRTDRSIQDSNEWLAWALALLTRHRETIAGVPVFTIPSRRGATAPGFPSLRERALASPAAAELIARLEALAVEAARYVAEMDFGFLYDPQRALFAIGYQPTSHTLDTSHYDLLASEARLASFVAIAKNDVPVDHWFHLGRELTRAAGETALMSWSGTMFEYLMPNLVMRTFPLTLLHQASRGAVHRQIAFGAARGVPWGISESAYNLRDRFQTYQYRTFGVPDLALKRGLDADLVVAPYASALAAMVDPTRALANLGLLAKRGALGPWGFRDALDYTRPSPGQRWAVVDTYMAHHLGMGLVALTNVLRGHLWHDRFHGDPLVRAAELLLYERIPRRLVLQKPQDVHPGASLPDPNLERPAVREFDTAHTPQPAVALLGRLPYTIMVTNGGSGYSRFETLAVTRWRADGTSEATGQFCYLKDVGSGRVWSAGHQPVCAPADAYHVMLATDRVVFHRTDGAIETREEITVAPDDGAEVRRITVTNNGLAPCELELTSYGEPVLASPESDRAHPAFGKLFVETEWHPWCSAMMATRRPRTSTERRLWCMHVVAVGDDVLEPVSYESDRSRFIGRGRSTRAPAALDPGAELSGTTGAVIDPIFAIRVKVSLQPGRSSTVAFTTLVAASRERAFELADRYKDPQSAQRALDLAWNVAQIELRELRTSSHSADAFQQLAGHLFFSDQRLRAPEPELRASEGTQEMLWGAGISGDWPILLATIDSIDGLPTLRQLLVAHQYWRRRGMTVDLVVLDVRAPSYVQELGDRITAEVGATGAAGLTDRPGGIFLRRQALLSAAELRMLRATARVHIPCDGRSLERILAALAPSAERVEETRPGPRGLLRTVAGLVERLRVPAPQRAPDPARPPAPAPGPAPATGSAGLLLDNGLGGLAPDGSYEIRIDSGKLPPAPWANVIANEHGGILMTERGSGFSWAGSSYFFRLTPWHNDPISDPIGDVVYLEDVATGELWSATPAPIPHPSPFTVRHSAGSSCFVHQHGDLETTLTVGLADGAPIRLSRLRIVNHGSVTRQVRVTAYVEWVLGSEREHTQHQISTEFDLARGAILARNTFHAPFGSWFAFCALTPRVERYTADRREFLGRHGHLGEPAALGGRALSGRSGAGLDPCAALQCTVDIAPGEAQEVTVVLGAGASRAEALAGLDAHRDQGQGSASAGRTVGAWRERLSILRVQTPEPAFDAMMNHWLLYQSLSCRMWGRSGLYQSSGAYGFRDQLQDSMALVYAEPTLAREHLLRSAARQFVEADVQHWWHPESGSGVRTRISDDLAWLPFAVDHYLRVTGDAAVLDTSVPFLEMRGLRPEEHDVYAIPATSRDSASLYEHCLRALRHASTVGGHGLPLIGGGDWNDGMDRVGLDGRGESVWLAWFLISALRGFARIADLRGDSVVSADFRERADAYARAAENQGWDGAWYRRAFFDDGTPLGSAANAECRIDSIAQSWSVISGASNPDHRAQAMASLEQHLVDEEARLVKLLTPPFEHPSHDPGYIQGYLAGVRENGAQYTHAATWVVLARALSGDGDRAFALFQMLNPLMHARTPAEVATYKVEPYVIAADVYTVPGQVGR
ncbi:MAG TPA: glucoamylase family protein, partial [Myxococcaceae bacterium]